MTADRLIGKRLNEYRLDRLVGQGGMARVYLATDVTLKRQVTIKVISAPFDSDSEYMARFKREAQAIARLEHPNVVRLYRYGNVKGTVYMAMQYIDGSNLRTLLDSYRRSNTYLDLEFASHIIQQICVALDYAHAQGVIHRDIKPSNILLDNQGAAFLADFGLARLIDVATQGKAFGSVHYMAPEQAISSRAVVPQSDLYSLGVVLYEMLAGQCPFDSENLTDIALMHMDEAPPSLRNQRPTLGKPIDAMVMRALAKQPQDRYPSGVAFYNAFARALQGDTSSQTSASPTLVSREKLAQRIRAAAAGDLPPIPAAALAHATSAGGTTQPDPTAAPSRSRTKPRRITVYLLASLALSAMLIASALFGPIDYLITSDDDQIDSDQDGIIATEDNCPTIANPTQADRDGNGIGDACQNSDLDALIDIHDDCPLITGVPTWDGCPVNGTINATSSVYLRSGPGQGYTQVGTLAAGDEVGVWGRHTNEYGEVWLRVYDYQSDSNAWIDRDLVRINTSLSTLPQVD